jgi:hypothetical protein
MSAIPNHQTAGLSTPRTSPFLVSHRFWIYVTLILLALAVIVLDRRANPGASPNGSSAKRAATTAPETPDDRPLLLPDR